MNERFIWIPLYKALSDWFLLGKDNQPELISILKDVGITEFRDGYERGEDIELVEIDPFTFFSYFNKFHSDERRTEILQDLRRKLEFRCPEPTDVAGILSMFEDNKLDREGIEYFKARFPKRCETISCLGDR